MVGAKLPTPEIRCRTDMRGYRRRPYIRGSVQQSVQSADHRGRGHVARLRQPLIAPGTSVTVSIYQLLHSGTGIVKFRGHNAVTLTQHVWCKKILTDIFSDALQHHTSS